MQKRYDDVMQKASAAVSEIGKRLMETPWTRAKKTKSQLQEKSIGRMEGGKQQVNSGRFWRWKRDGILHNFLIEARTTDAESYRIERKEFVQMRKQALQTPPGLLPGMQIDIQDLSLMCIETSAFQDMNLRLVELETKLERYEEEDES